MRRKTATMRYDLRIIQIQKKKLNVNNISQQFCLSRCYKVVVVCFFVNGQLNEVTRHGADAVLSNPNFFCEILQPQARRNTQKTTNRDNTAHNNHRNMELSEILHCLRRCRI